MIDTIFWLRVSYTIVGIVGAIWAIRCLRRSYTAAMIVRLAQQQESLLRIANAYFRRDMERLAILLLVAGAGIVAIVGDLALRSVFGLVVLLLIALVATYGSWADAHDREEIIKRETADRRSV